MLVRKGKKVKRLFFLVFRSTQLNVINGFRVSLIKLRKCLNILEYVVDTGSLILLTFEEEDISYPLCLLLTLVRYLHHPYHVLIQELLALLN